MPSTLLTAQLLFLEAESPTQPIKLYINSPGGSVTAGLAIYDTMQYISSPVHTYCMGQAASMGSLLLAGGERGHRYALKHGSVMIHRESTHPPAAITATTMSDAGRCAGNGSLMVQNHREERQVKLLILPCTRKRSCGYEPRLLTYTRPIAKNPMKSWGQRGTDSKRHWRGIIS